MLDDPDVNVDPDATSDDDPVKDSDETAFTLATWLAVTEDDPVFLELEDPVLKEDDELRVEPLFKEFEDPIVIADEPLLVELEDPELILEIPDVRLDPDATSWAAVTEDNPVFKELDDSALKEDDELSVEPVFTEFDDPIVIAEDLLSVELEDPELKLEEPDVKLEPEEATSDDDPVDDPDEVILSL